ncbi:hypothetical protein D3C85_1153840 [compost metagenome]
MVAEYDGPWRYCDGLAHLEAVRSAIGGAACQVLQVSHEVPETGDKISPSLVHGALQGFRIGQQEVCWREEIAPLPGTEGNQFNVVRIHARHLLCRLLPPLACQGKGVHPQLIRFVPPSLRRATRRVRNIRTGV